MEYEQLCRENLGRHEAGLDRIAKGVQRVLRLSYTRLFEHEQAVHRLPPGTIRRELFDESVDARVAAQRERIRRSCLTGASIYTFCFVDGDVVGVAKTSPARVALSHRLRLAEPDCYLNDIAVSVPHRGVGSTLLRMALADCAGGRHVLLDVFEGNTLANEWFTRLGFTPLERQPAGLDFVIGDFVIPRVRMSAASVYRDGSAQRR